MFSWNGKFTRLNTFEQYCYQQAIILTNPFIQTLFLPTPSSFAHTHNSTSNQDVWINQGQRTETSNIPKINVIDSYISPGVSVAILVQDRYNVDIIVFNNCSYFCIDTIVIQKLKEDED